MINKTFNDYVDSGYNEAVKISNVNIPKFAISNKGVSRDNQISRISNNSK